MNAPMTGPLSHQAQNLLLNLQRAQEYGEEIAGDIKRIYIIACGAGHQLGLSLRYHSKIISKKVAFEVVASGEFICRPPPELDNHTLCILASKSGKTVETVKVAQWLEDLSHDRTMAITQDGTSPLANLCREVFVLDKEDDATLAISILMHIVVGSVWAAQDGWPMLPRLVRSFRNLPEACKAAAIFEAERAGKDATACRNDELMYFVGGGPQEMSTFVVGVCNLTENFKMHVPIVQASTFFHGAVEASCKAPCVLFLGEDHDRPLMEAVKNFSEKHVPRLMVYDSRNYKMEGIDEEIRPFAAPLVLRNGAKSFVHSLSDVRNVKLGARTFMNKVDNLTGKDLVF